MPRWCWETPRQEAGRARNENVRGGFHNRGLMPADGEKNMEHHERFGVGRSGNQLDAMRERFASKLSNARHVSSDRTSELQATNPADAQRSAAPKHASSPSRVRRVRVANTCPVNRGRAVSAQVVPTEAVPTETVSAEAMPANTQAPGCADTLRASCEGTVQNLHEAASSAKANLESAPSASSADTPRAVSASTATTQSAVLSDSIEDAAIESASATPSAAADSCASNASRKSASNKTNKTLHIYKGAVAMNVQKASTQGSSVVENAAKRLRAYAAVSTKQAKTATSAKQAKDCSMKPSKGERRARKGVAFRMFTAAALAASLCFGTVASAFGDDPASANEAAQETPATNVENAATTEAPSNIEMINTTTRLENGGSGNTITGTVSMNAYTDVFQVDGVTYRSIFSLDEQAALQVEPQAAIIGLTDDQLGAESIEIPATVSSAGNEYKVVALGERAATQARNAADPNADASIKDMHLLGNGAGAAGISAKNPALEKLLLPDSLTYIDVDALAVFQSLKTIEVNVGNPVFAGHMGTLLMTNDFEQSVQDAEGVTVAYIPSAMRNVELPEHATGIFSEAAPYAKGVAGFHVPKANTHLTSTADLLLRGQEDDTLAVALLSLIHISEPTRP